MGNSLTDGLNGTARTQTARAKQIVQHSPWDVAALRSHAPNAKFAPERTETVENKSRSKDKHERTRDAAREAQRQEGHIGRGECHGAGREGTHGQCDDEPGAPRATHGRRYGQKRSSKVAREIRRGEEARGALRHSEVLYHQGQNRGIDEPANAHRGGERDESSESK